MHPLQASFSHNVLSSPLLTFISIQSLHCSTQMKQSFFWCCQLCYSTFFLSKSKQPLILLCIMESALKWTLWTSWSSVLTCHLMSHTSVHHLLHHHFHYPFRAGLRHWEVTCQRVMAALPYHSLFGPPLPSPPLSSLSSLPSPSLPCRSPPLPSLRSRPPKYS